MPKIMSFPTDCGLKQSDWIGCLINDNLPWFVHENSGNNIPSDLRSSDAIVLDGKVFTVWKRVVIPFREDGPLRGCDVVYLAWRLTDD